MRLSAIIVPPRPSNPTNIVNLSNIIPLNYISEGIGFLVFQPLLCDTGVDGATTKISCLPVPYHTISGKFRLSVFSHPDRRLKIDGWGECVRGLHIRRDSAVTICSRFVREIWHGSALDYGRSRVHLYVSINIVGYSDARNRSMLDSTLTDRQTYMLGSCDRRRGAAFEGSKGEAL